MYEADFLDLLKKEYDHYAQLKETALLKKDIIIKNDINRLAEIVKDEQQLIDSINELEERRREILFDLAEKNDIEQERVIPYKELLKLLTPELKEELKKLRRNFLGLLSELEDINKNNRQLIQDSLKINNYSFELIQEAFGKNKTYVKNGGEKPNSESFIDRKA